MKVVKNGEGITLIALAITIIVLMILAGVSWIIVNNYMIEKAVLASGKAEEAAEHERKELNWFGEWSVDNANKNLLRENVKLGDYIEYPMEYKDVFTGEHYDATRAWRVVEASHEGVKIISTGMPAKWYYRAGNTSFMDDFENLTDLRDAQKDYIRAKDFAVRGLSSKIETLSLADLNHFCNKIYGTNRREDDISPVPENCELFYLSVPNTYYWLATTDKADSNKLYRVENYAITSASELRLGVRLVILLDKNATGILEDGIWKNVN